MPRIVMTRHPFEAVLIASCAVLAVGSPCPGGQPTVAFERRPGSLSITVGGRPFARYRYDDERITRPYFEDLFTPAGSRVTRHNPPIEGQDLADHPTFHPGLWMAFGDLGGADCWRNRDRVQHVGFVGDPQGGPARGTFTVRNRYRKGDQSIAEERCRIDITASPNAYLLLWESWFTPVGEDLVFGDQEEMGLGVRLATPLAVRNGGRITDSAGRVDEAQVWGKQADWCAYTGRAEGKPVGVLLVPDPSNFRRCWFHARDYGLLAANPFGRHAFTRGEVSRVVVRRGTGFPLRYAVLVFDGEPDVEAVMRELRESPMGRAMPPR
jgi:hypothetical protein